MDASPPLVLSEAFNPAAEIFTPHECEIAKAIDSSWKRADDVPHQIVWLESAAALFLAVGMRLEHECRGPETHVVAQSSRKMAKLLTDRAVAETRAAGFSCFDLAEARQAYTMAHRPA